MKKKMVSNNFIIMPALLNLLEKLFSLIQNQRAQLGLQSGQFWRKFKFMKVTKKLPIKLVSYDTVKDYAYIRFSVSNGTKAVKIVSSTHFNNKEEKYDYTLMESLLTNYNSADKFKTEEDYKAEKLLAPYKSENTKGKFMN